ncbi:M50 family metallopeptidase [Amycolatopsis anabasis]|uniref:M50 family metallopeptidase n=1 Tax=Amycolatopsis anabasis TaxID=1840409 RepID=UPI00131E8221|nr:site-2 protease family protein [Amycolatopsis anabasis]
MLAYVFGVVLFALCIGLSVALHEAGHLLSAKAFGMKVRRFFVGYGPTAFSFRRGETEYGLKWIPLGGFCDIAGMTALDELTPDEAPRAMWRFKTWKRTIVLASGALTHFVLGFVVLYLMATTMGLPNTTREPVLASVSNCVQDARTVDQINNPACAPGQVGPAEAAGIRPGDTVVSVAGKPTPTWNDMLAVVQTASGPTPFEVRRGDQTLRLTVDVPQVERPKGDQIVRVGAVGVGFASMFQYGPIDALGGAATFAGNMFSQTWQKLIEFPQRIPAVVHSIFGGERDPNTPISVVGASRIGGEAVEAGLWPLFLLLLAGLNFFMGVFNLLPLLPLDGGHIAITWYEKIRDSLRRLRGKAARGPVDYTRLATITMVLVVIGGAVMLLTITADVVNPIRLTQ